MEKKMKKSKMNSTERALIASALSIVLCCAMLFGTTYAWFNQTVVANVGVIQTGTLTAQIVDADGKEFVATAGEDGAVLEFMEVGTGGTLIIPAEGEKTIFEPGKTYQLPAIRIKNPGTIDFNYEVIMEGIVKPATETPEEGTSEEAQGEEATQEGETVTADLRDVLIFTATVGTAVEGVEPEVINLTPGDKVTGTLSATGAAATTDVDERLSDIITISAAFDTSVDLTAYQGLQLSDVKIIVYATQLLESENDD